MEKEINLTFKREEFEKIFFKNDQGSYTKSPTVKTAWQVLMVALVISLVSIIATRITGQAGLVMVLAVIGTLAAAAFYMRCMMTLFKWKESIHLYLNRVAEKGEAKIILSETEFTFIQGGERSVEKWEAIRALAVEDDHIGLHASTQYLFPKGCMTAEEFDFLAAFAEERIKA